MYSRGLISFWLPVLVLVCVALSTLRMYQVSSLSEKSYKKTRGYSRLVHEDRAFNYTKITYMTNDAPAAEDDSLLVVATIANHDSYGGDRSFEDFFSVIKSFDYDQNAMSLGFYFGDESEFNTVDKYLRHHFGSVRTNDQNARAVSKVTILLAPFLEKDYNSIDRSQRHNDNVQRLRRRNIARTRNFALFHTLAEERYTLFMDADVVSIKNPDMITRFIASKKDIIVPRVTRGSNIDYDKNSWVGERTVPNEDQFLKMDQNDWEHWDYVPRDVPGKMTHFQDLIQKQEQSPPDDPSRSPNYMVKLDSVGGAILFAKSIIYKQGVAFPPNYIIGTTWQRLEGYDGIETEGLCYIAKSLNYECWGMPNMVGQHVD
ncbi:Mannan polymerase complex subunit mnn9 [Meyerozyma sp. JA9]|nr:Mannan polymerase complex subunit mnn9 [Meyerozyma sp. JA9]